MAHVSAHNVFIILLLILVVYLLFKPSESYTARRMTALERSYNLGNQVGFTAISSNANPEARGLFGVVPRTIPINSVNPGVGRNVASNIPLRGASGIGQNL